MFLAQQAGEKALKSILYYLGARRVVLLTPSVVEMVQEAHKKEKRFEELIDDTRELYLHYFLLTSNGIGVIILLIVR